MSGRYHCVTNVAADGTRTTFHYHDGAKCPDVRDRCSHWKTCRHTACIRTRP